MSCACEVAKTGFCQETPTQRWQDIVVIARMASVAWFVSCKIASSFLGLRLLGHIQAESGMLMNRQATNRA